jgi:hypothetical protein
MIHSNEYVIDPGELSSLGRRCRSIKSAVASLLTSDAETGGVSCNAKALPGGG